MPTCTNNDNSGIVARSMEANIRAGTVNTNEIMDYRLGASPSGGIKEGLIEAIKFHDDGEDLFTPAVSAIYPSASPSFQFPQ